MDSHFDVQVGAWLSPIENEMESLGLVESTKLALREIRKTSEPDKFKTPIRIHAAIFS